MSLSRPTKPLLFYTAPISYDGENRVSVARKRLPIDSQEGLTFAPSWAILAPAVKLRQQGLETQASWEAYAALYRAEMRLSYVKHAEDWRRLLERPRAVLCCYCDLARHPGRCHRLPLAEMLKKCGAVYLGEVQTDSHAGWLDLGAAEGGAA